MGGSFEMTVNELPPREGDAPEVGLPEAFQVGREFAHFHPPEDGSLPPSQPDSRAWAPRRRKAAHQTRSA